MTALEAAPETSALSMAGISKSFGVVKALRSVSLEVHRGEILALMGENGAGKSTLLKIMSGALIADAGTIMLDGVEHRFSSPHDARAAGIRVVYQEPDIIPDISIAENLFTGELPRNGLRLVEWDRLNAAARDLLDQFRVGRGIDPAKQAANLTAAERQMIEILRALRQDVRVLALDEPTSSLTESETEDLFRLVRALRDRGIALIYVSHRMNEILGLCDRVAVLRDGAFVGEKPARDLDEARIISMMVGRALGDGARQRRTVDPEVVLEARGVTNKHVRDISFKLHRGEVLGVSGLVGAGRSELAKTLFGVFPMDRGSILVEGKQMEIASPRDAIRAGLAYAPEERKTEGIFPELSVLANGSVAILRAISPWRIVNSSRERAIVGELAEKMSVKTPSMEQTIRKLSGGNQQKLVLGRWLATRPKILMLDEPTRGIDVGAKAEIYRIIDDLAASGVSILLISSEMNEIIGLSDRVLCIRDGGIAAEFDAGNLSEESILRSIMPA